MLGDATVGEGIDAEALERLRVGGEDARANQSKRDLLLNEMNSKHSFIANYGGKAVVTDLQPEPTSPNQQRITFVGLDQIKARYSNRYVPPVKNDGKDEGGYKELGAWWIKHPKRREFAGIRFVPGGPEILWFARKSYLNLWQGWAVEPKEGDWSLMRKHIREVLADGDPLADLYIIRWLAWMVQNPDKRAEVALVIRGKKGCGKGTLTKVLLRMVGLHGRHVSDQEHLTGKHNAHLQDCVLLIADEAYWAGDKRAEGALKRMVTEPTLTIEPKFVNAFEVPNLLHIIMTANEEWVVPASEDERRFGVCDASDTRLGDAEYFKALNAEIDGGGAAAMLYDLLGVALGDWHPRDIYINEALRQQQAQSLRGTIAFYEQILQDGVIPGATPENPYRTRFEVLFRRAQQADRMHIGRMSPKKFADELTKLGVLRVKGGGNQKFREFLPLLEARAVFAKRFRGGVWRWENDELKEWVADAWGGFF